MARDRVAAAVAAVAAVAAAEQPPPERRASLRIGMPTGRQLAINIPADLTADEAIFFMGYIATQLPVELAKLRQPGPQLIVPAHVVARS